MTDLNDDNPALDLPQRVDHALEAFWRGQAAELEHLVDPLGAPGQGVGKLLDELRIGPALPVTGLTGDCAVAGYEIIRELGRGGMGVVYEAEQHEPRRRVALKVFGGLAADQYRLSRFRQEIQLQAPLRHPAIATLYAAGRTLDGRPFFTMELVRGEPLDRYVRQRQLSVSERLVLFLPICDAVQYAHEHKVIHRDLKPANILVDTDGQPRILDFGLAHMTDADVTATVTAAGMGRVAGTLAYMSPEQARGQPSEIREPSDVYALGVILYELLTGQLPYEVGKVLPHEALRVICEQAPRRPSAICGALRGDLETIVLKALEKDVVCRYQAAGELREDLRRYLANEPICARRTSGWYVLHKRLTRHRSAVKFMAAVLVIGLIGAAGGLWWRAHWLAQRDARELYNTRRLALDAMAALDVEDVERGYALAHAAYERHPDVPEARLVLAQALFRHRWGVERHTAIRELNSGRRQDPTRWEYAALLAEIYRNGRDAAQAEPLEALVARRMPDTSVAWYLRSLATLERQKALGFVREAVGRPGAGPLAWERFTNLCLLAGDLEGALRGTDVLIETSGNVNQWMLVKGRLLDRAGQFPQALAQFDAVIRLNEDGYMYRAHVYRHMGDFAKAIADYSTVIRLAESARGPMTTLPAIPAEFQPGREPEPRLWAYYHRATALWMLGDVPAAIADCKRIQPALGRPFYSDARLYVMFRGERRDADAEEVLARALAEIHDDNPWLRQIFRCLAREITPDALINDAAARPHLGYQCEAGYYAGEVYRLAGELDRARACFEQCKQTGAAYDPSRPLEPMTEYELAGWRLKQLPGEQNAPAPAHD